MTKVTPFLMFNNQHDAAIEFYKTTFPDSEVRKVSRSGSDGPVTSAEFVGGLAAFHGLQRRPAL